MMMKRIGSRNRTFPAVLVGLVVAGVLCTAAGTALAQHCRLHYAEAFQQVTVNNLAGRSQVEIKKQIESLGGQRGERESVKKVAEGDREKRYTEIKDRLAELEAQRKPLAEALTSDVVSLYSRDRKSVV